MYFYQAYGLQIRSEFHLPELVVGGNGRDLWIRRGEVSPPEMTNSRIPRQGIEAWFGGTLDEAYLQWGEIVTFCAQAGQTLTVAPGDRANPQLLNLYILSEALGLILHQRGLMLIHASAIRIRDAVVIFVGVPGEGKSTTAAAFAQRGHLVLSDDMVAIDFSRPQPMVLPAFPQIKIWSASVKGLNYNESTLAPLFPGSTKRTIRQTEDFEIEGIPLAQVLFLETGDRFSLDRLDASEAIVQLTRFFSCPNPLLQGTALSQHFDHCTQLLHTVPVNRLTRPKSFPALQQLITWVEEGLPLTAERLHLPVSMSI